MYKTQTERSFIMMILTVIVIVQKCNNYSGFFIAIFLRGGGALSLEACCGN